MNLIGIKSAAGCAPEVVDRWDERCLDAMHTYCRRWGLAACQMKGYRAALDEPGFVSYRDEGGNTGALVNLDANPDPAALAGPVGEPDTGQLVSLLAEATAHEIDRKAGPVFYAVESCDGEDAQVCLTYTDPETAVTAEARRWNEYGEEVETLFGQLREGTGIVSFGPLRGCRGVLINPERDHRERTFTMAAGHLLDTGHPTDEQVEQLRQQVAAVPIYRAAPELISAESVEVGDAIDLDADGRPSGEPRTVLEVREMNGGARFYFGFDDDDPGASFAFDERVWLMSRPDEYDPADSIGQRAQQLAEQAAKQAHDDLDGVIYRAVVGAIKHGNFAGDVDPLLVVAFQQHFVRVLRQLIENGLREGPGDEGPPPVNPTTYLVHEPTGTAYALDGGELIWCPTGAGGVPRWSDGGLLEYTEPEHEQTTDVIRRALEKWADDRAVPNREFKLSIRLESATMSKPGDVADALLKVAVLLSQGAEQTEGESIRDAKGRNVGFWTLALPEAKGD